VRIPLMNPDGSGKERLTHAPGKEDGTPKLSLDSARVVFTRSKRTTYQAAEKGGPQFANALYCDYAYVTRPASTGVALSRWELHE
jgi:hypothetical protein